MKSSIPLAGVPAQPNAPRKAGDEDLRSLLTELNDGERSGIAVATNSAGDTTRIHLRRGTIVAVEQPTSASAWVLAEYLLRTKSITTGRLLRARQRAEKRDQTLEEVLVEKQFVSVDLLKRLLGLQTEEALLPLFREAGLRAYFIEERPIPSPIASPLPVSYILKEGARQAAQWPALRQQVGRPDAIYGHEGPLATAALGYGNEDEDEDAAELSGNARLVYFFVNGRRTTEQIARCCTLSLFQTMTAMGELMDAYLVSLVTTHGKGEEIRERSAFLPRLVWIGVTLALIGVVGLLGARLGETKSLSATREVPKALQAAVDRSALRDLRGSLRLHHLRMGHYPATLDTVSGGLLSQPITSSPMEYSSDDEGFWLSLKTETP